MPSLNRSNVKTALEYKENIVAFSGGKDSTALAFLLKENGVDFDLLFTSAGNEPPELYNHINDIVKRLNVRIIKPKSPTLFDVIESQKCIPNFRMRFCTRMIKIEPCIRFFKKHGNGKILHIGLRADEPKRKGIYDEFINRRFFLRENGMDIQDVVCFLEKKNILIPRRTDCMLCPFQGLNDWLWLWQTHPDEYQKGVLIEEKYGRTFRNPNNKNWPCRLYDLRTEFKNGRRPRKRIDRSVCRICTM